MDRLLLTGTAPPLQPLLFEDLDGLFGAPTRKGTSDARPYTTTPSRARIWVEAQRIMSTGRCSLSDASRVALGQLEQRYNRSPLSQQKATREVARFFRYLERVVGLRWLDEIDHDAVQGFVWASSSRRGRLRDISATTAANRQSMIRAALDELERLGLWDGTDVVGSPIPRSESTPTRPLTPAELEALRAHATGVLFPTRSPLLVALSEAGASAAEIAETHLDDLNPTNATVALRGKSARVNPLTPWGENTIRTWSTLTHPVTGSRLCAGSSLSTAEAAHSVTVGLNRLLASSGLTREPGVTARSIRLTAARRVLDERGIEAAARFLGHDSLDSTADALGHDWRSLG